jgi:hypothetical protein
MDWGALPAGARKRARDDDAADAALGAAGDAAGDDTRDAFFGAAAPGIVRGAFGSGAGRGAPPPARLWDGGAARGAAFGGAARAAAAAPAPAPAAAPCCVCARADADNAPCSHCDRPACDAHGRLCDRCACVFCLFCVVSK